MATLDNKEQASSSFKARALVFIWGFFALCTLLAFWHNTFKEALGIGFAASLAATACLFVPNPRLSQALLGLALSVFAPLLSHESHGFFGGTLMGMGVLYTVFFLSQSFLPVAMSSTGMLCFYALAFFLRGQGMDIHVFPETGALHEVELTFGELLATVVLFAWLAHAFVRTRHTLVDAEEDKGYFSEIIESLGEGIRVFDAQGHIYQVNQAYCNLLGYSREELLSMSQGRAMPGTDEKTARESKKYQDDALSTGETVRFESVRINKRGEAVPVMITYKKLHRRADWPADRLVSVVTNISAIKEAIDGLSEAITRLAQGDLITEVAGEYQGDFVQIARALKALRARLVEAVGTVRDVAEHMGEAAQEIAQGSEDLASRTERQAAAIEEISASIDTISKGVAETSTHAQDAKERARDAYDRATQGEKGMQEMLTAMEGIVRASTRIGKMLELIQSLSSQTNLLALNAAIEAAKSGGEVGRGFSVIAQEIRRLAEKSENSTKDIQGLVQEVSQRVQAGQEKTSDAKESFTSIVLAVTEMVSLVETIASSSIEHASSIEEINRAITDFSKSSEENAALVEEYSTAASSLRDEGKHLQDAVRFFKVARKTA